MCEDGAEECVRSVRRVQRSVRRVQRSVLGLFGDSANKQYRSCREFATGIKKILQREHPCQIVVYSTWIQQILICTFLTS